MASARLSASAKRVLKRMQSNPVSLRPSEIGSGTGLSATKVEDALIELGERGLVEAVTLRLTEEGRAA